VKSMPPTFSRLGEKEGPATRQRRGRMRGCTDLSARGAGEVVVVWVVGRIPETPVRPLILPSCAWAPPSPQVEKGSGAKVAAPPSISRRIDALLPSPAWGEGGARDASAAWEDEGCTGLSARDARGFGGGF